MYCGSRSGRSSGQGTRHHCGHFFTQRIFVNSLQTTISGSVTDPSGIPIIGANIYLDGTYDGASSDDTGNFLFTTEETDEQTTATKQSSRGRNQEALKEYLKQQKFDKENNFDQYLIDGFGNSFDPYANSTSKGRKPTNRSKLNIGKNRSQYFRLDNDFINRGYSVLKNNLDITTQERKEKNQPTSTIGFIPVNLSVELEGISGIKIFNKLVVNTTTLPYNYPETLEFIIKKVSHSLSNNKWVTKLETISIPKMDKKIESDKTTDTETQTSNSQE